MKRILACLIVLCLLCCCAAAETVSLPVTAEGAIFGGTAGDKISLTLDFDTAWVTQADNTVYNPDLAAACALLCADSYFRAKDVDKGTANRVVVDGAEEYTNTALLTALGCGDVRYIESYKVKQVEFDGNDSATLLLGYRDADSCDSYVVVLRGCFSIGERLSCFDVGADTEEYFALTGEHPEWKDTAAYKGLSVAAERAEEFVKEYMAEHDRADCPDTVLVTGHSRGADVALLVGAALEDEGVKSYTYTFNAMPVSAEAGEYKTIFNIFDTNDYYSDPLPIGGEKPVRPGTDVCADIASDAALRAAIAEVKGRDDYQSLSAELKAEYDGLFAARFPSRASLYEMQTATESYASAEEAAARREEVASYIDGFGIGAFCSVSEVSGENTLEIRFCGAALLFGLAQIQAYGAVAYDAYVSLFASDEAGCRLAQIVFDNAAAITGGHLLVNGYVLSAR